MEPEAACAGHDDGRIRYGFEAETIILEPRPQGTVWVSEPQTASTDIA